MNTIKLQQRGTLTLPKSLRESLNIIEGDMFRVFKKDSTIILEPINSSPDSDLLSDISGSLKEIKQGKFIEFKSVTEFKKKLKLYEKN